MKELTEQINKLYDLLSQRFIAVIRHKTNKYCVFSGEDNKNTTLSVAKLEGFDFGRDVLFECSFPSLHDCLNHFETAKIFDGNLSFGELYFDCTINTDLITDDELMKID